MTLSIITSIAFILSLLFFALIIKRLLQKRFTTAFIHTILGSITSTIATLGALLLFNIYFLHQITKDTPIAMVSLSQLTSEQYQATLSLPSGQIKTFKLNGNDWQLSAQIIVWDNWLHALGLTNRYQFDRIQGRYNNIDDESHKPRSIYSLSQSPVNSLWQWGKNHHIERYFIKTVYGNAVFMPMSDGASFTISLTANGLIATPINLAAKKSIGLA
ncbi:hypothetical protein [Piscirickettsia litoralis]|uniref:Cation/multidrug efflux pump n=1 Tax=Piscirickettsia litoralis TaxID=1891921 RepID=A0ABX3AB64_9GAMM|nr:hypothetical protein [Piscirickettsia litoralis]ODN43379.1 hypothetical protein BGC07_11145 [Piscirickettsia litoralis]